MLFSELAEYFERIERENLRNRKTEILAEILKKVSLEEVDLVVYLALGGLRPEFDRLEFNLAEKMILRAVGVSIEEYKKVGDLGEIIYQKIGKSENPENRRIRRSDSQSVSEVYEELVRIAKDSGTGSQERKVGALARLVGNVDAISAKYIVRIVAGKLRLGFSDKTILDALSYFENGTKDYSDLLDRAFQKRPDVGALAKTVKAVGAAKAVVAVDVTIGTPILSALAQRLKTADEMIEKMGRVLVEPKFDGSRVQIHFSRKEKEDHVRLKQTWQGGLFAEEKLGFWVKSFTRNLDESTNQFPELLYIEEQIKAHEVILDSEAVGYDPKTGEMVPFQMTITRKRKHGVVEASSNVPLRFYVFDIMYLDGKSLIHLPLLERRAILKKVIGEGNVLVVDEAMETDNPDELREYHQQKLEEGLEGVLVKQVDGEYMPGRTGFNWVKFKEAEDSAAKLSDTIDGVVMGYYRGRGKRSGFGLGAFLIGVRKEQEIVTIAKIGTGITDLEFAGLYEQLKELEVKDQPSEYRIEKTLVPDVWVTPQLVVEVAADEITVSPTHTAGYALRFPRLVGIRTDKGVQQSTTLDEIEEMRR